jgi:hypothetical protein
MTQQSSSLQAVGNCAPNMPAPWMRRIIHVSVSQGDWHARRQKESWEGKDDENITTLSLIVLGK